MPQSNIRTGISKFSRPSVNKEWPKPKFGAAPSEPEKDMIDKDYGGPQQPAEVS
jgi:hypothetical protein